MASYDPAWLDVQYNNRARIAEHPQIFERWARASALARERLAGSLDLPYGSEPGETLDVFDAPRPGAPVLVFIHGGWWRSLDKRDLSFVAPSFVDAGAMVVVPNYALCPAVTIEAIALQMTHALAWIWRNAAKHGGDARRIVVAGHSAGGHLATMLLGCDWKRVGADLPHDLVRAVLSISGVFDLEAISQTPFLKADLRLSAQSAWRLGPAHFPPPAGVLYAVAGANESEEFLRQNELIRARWGAAVVPVCETIPATNHLDVLHEFADPQARLHGLALDLLGLARQAEST